MVFEPKREGMLRQLNVDETQVEEKMLHQQKCRSNNAGEELVLSGPPAGPVRLIVRVCMYVHVYSMYVNVRGGERGRGRREGQVE